MKYFINIAAVTVALTVGFSSMAGARSLSIQTSQNTGDFTYKYVEEHWVPKLTAMTNGEIELKLLPIGAVVPAKEALGGMSAGVLDGVWNFVGRYAGIDPAYAILGDMVAAYDSPEQAQMFCMNGGGKEMLQKVHDRYTSSSVHVVGCGPYAREPLVAAKKFESIDDMKGVKIRAPEGLSSLLWQEVGATTVPIPYSEIYTALDKGIIEAANGSSYSNNAAAGINRLAQYPIAPGIASQAVIQFALNDRVWQSLTSSQQTAFEVWYIAMSTDARRVSSMHTRELQAKDRAGEGDVIEIVDWSKPERDRLREVAKGAWKEMAGRSELAREAYQIQLEYLRSQGLVK